MITIVLPEYSPNDVLARLARCLASSEVDDGSTIAFTPFPKASGSSITIPFRIAHVRYRIGSPSAQPLTRDAICSEPTNAEPLTKALAKDSNGVTQEIIDRRSSWKDMCPSLPEPEKRGERVSYSIRLRIDVALQLISQ